ncbi:hypothetical protein D3C86_2237360 [compost metagenome]
MARAEPRPCIREMVRKRYARKIARDGEVIEIVGNGLGILRPRGAEDQPFRLDNGQHHPRHLVLQR